MTQMGGDDGSGSSDEDGGANADDADATDSRRKSKKSDEMDYETDDNEDNVDKEDDEEVDIEDHPASEKTANISGDEEEEPKIEDQAEEALNVSVGELEEATEKMLVVKQSELINDYTYDKVNHRWCQVSFHIPLKFKDIDFTKLLRKIAEKSVVWEVPKIRKAITYMQNDQLYLKTDGINIYAMTKYTKILDLNRLYSNDIYAIAKTYGIEAASRVLVKEVQNVFQVYGITINPRHLLLVADYMTADGTYKSMSRKGMESNVSPLQQMSFESSIQFLKAAALKGNSDHLDSPSSRLMVGQLCKSGTGCFGVYSTVA